MEDRWRRRHRFGLSRRLNLHSSPTAALFLYCLAFGFAVMVLFRNSLYRDLGHLVLFAAVLSMLTLDPYNTVSDLLFFLKTHFGRTWKLIWAGARKASTFHWQKQRYNHGFRHCGVNKLPVAQNVMVTVCGRAEWHQSIMTSPLHLGGLCSPWSLGHGRCPAPMPLLASNLCLTLDVTDQHSLTLCVADLLCNFFYETITQCSKSRFEFCGDLFAATIVTIQSSVERRGDLEAAAIYCNGYSCILFALSFLFYSQPERSWPVPVQVRSTLRL
jgi:hypothetical protein